MESFYQDEIVDCTPIDISGKEVVFFHTRKKGPRITTIQRITGENDVVYCWMRRGSVVDQLYLNTVWRGFAGREINGDDIIRVSTATYGLVPLDVAKDVLIINDTRLKELLDGGELIYERDESGEIKVAFDSMWGRYEEEMMEELSRR